MGKHLMTALFSGFLVVGVATAFAEEPPVSDQDALKAWEGQTEVKTDRAIQLTTERKPGLTPLTDESLEEITGAGMGMIPELPLGLQLPVLPPSPPERPTTPGFDLPLSLKKPEMPTTGVGASMFP